LQRLGASPASVLRLVHHHRQPQRQVRRRRVKAFQTLHAKLIQIVKVCQVAFAVLTVAVALMCHWHWWYSCSELWVFVFGSWQSSRYKFPPPLQECYEGNFFKVICFFRPGTVTISGCPVMRLEVCAISSFPVAHVQVCDFKFERLQLLSLISRRCETTVVLL